MASRSKTSDSKAVSAFSLLMMPRSGNYPTFQYGASAYTLARGTRGATPWPGTIKRCE
jgi:hypothetical protein